MDAQPNQHNRPNPDASLLAAFLQELNIARRNLTLYPPEHPQLVAASNKVLGLLEKLFVSKAQITFGIAPEALFYEHQWLDKENRTFQTFASALSCLGIASLSIQPGLTATELLRFCQMLRTNRQTIEEHGGFKRLLHQQQIFHIALVPIDYSAFQASLAQPDKQAATDTDLWEDFLHGLLDDILDSTDGGLRLDPITIAEILNEKLAADDSSSALSPATVNNFVTRFLNKEQALPERSGGKQLGELLAHLTPHLQESFLAGAIEALDNNPEAAQNVLEQLPADLLHKTIAPQPQQALNISPRLIALMTQLSTNSSAGTARRTSSDSGPLEKDMVRARLDVLFKEEQHDLFMPQNYQAALANSINIDINAIIPQEDRPQLKESYENQPVELQCSAVIFELLGDGLGLEDEDAIQRNLHELSRFFLDTGNFSALADIYHHWSRFVYSDQSKASIFSERVLASHSQQTFMREVLDGLDLWGEEQADPIHHYIASVGQAYTELVIEQLGQARQFSRRSYWMKVLEAIGSDANQLLVQALADERWYLIRNLLTVLGKNIDQATLKAVHQLSDHPHPKVRQEVIRVLFRCNPATANRLLRKELTSSDPEAQLAAIQIADRSNDPEILNLLHQLLQKELNSDFELQCKQQLLATLARIGSRESLSLLRVLLQKKSLLPSRRQKQFQRDILHSLSTYPRDLAETLLQDLAAGKKRQQSQLAAELLQQLKEKPS